MNDIYLLVAKKTTNTRYIKYSIIYGYLRVDWFIYNLNLKLCFNEFMKNSFIDYRFFFYEDF